MSENNVRILYREIVGAGDDEESNEPNGILVTLSFFPSDDWRAPAHYILHEVLMINRQYVTNNRALIVDQHWQSDSRMIRQAIKRMDELKEGLKEFEPEAQS